jgi:hypothetical protein
MGRLRRALTEWGGGTAISRTLRVLCSAGAEAPAIAGESWRYGTGAVPPR